MKEITITINLQTLVLVIISLMIGYAFGVYFPITGRVVEKGIEKLPEKPLPEEEERVKIVGLEGRPYLGNKNAKVIMVEFSDFQCPFSKRAFERNFPRIKEEYIDKGKLVYYFFDFPLAFHEQATIAAIAARCAGEQGKFWEMHDLLFEKQEEWSGKEDAKEIFKKYAKQIGLNEEQFNSCIDNEKYKDKVQADYNYGSRIGIRGTPTFFINGKKIVGAQPYEKFKQAIEEELS